MVEEYDVKKQFEEFFNAYLSDQLRDTAAAFPEKRSLDVDFAQLSRFNPDLADETREKPDILLSLAEDAIQEMNLVTGKKFRPHIRLYNLPPAYYSTVQHLGAEHLNKLVAAEGVITMISQTQPKMASALWQCIHCDETIKTIPQKNAIVKPIKCKCGYGDFRLLESSSEFVDIQRSELQDPMEKIKGNVTAPKVKLWIEDDLTNVISPGENVLIVGILRLMQNPQAKGRSSVYLKYFDVIHVQKMAKEFEELEVSKEEEAQIVELSKNPRLYDLIVRSVAPSIYGHDEAKLAIALQLFGGTPNKVLPDGKKIRSDIHVLLVGDPGCLVADERIVLGNGAIVKIGEIGSTHLQPLDLQVLTGEGGAARDAATKYHVYEQQPIIEIVTESGKSIKGTPNHPLLWVRGEDGVCVRSWKRLDEFKVGDSIAVVTGFPCTITRVIPTGWGTKPRKFGPKFKGKLPKLVTPQLAGLLGYLLGDGWVQKYRAGFIVAEPEKDVLERLVRTAESLFGIKPLVTKRVRSDRKIPVYYANIGSEDVASCLSFLKEKRVPNLVLQSGNKVAAEFLKWLFEADGTVFNKGRGRRAVGLKAKNIELLRDVQILLLRFGIHSRIVGNALLIRRGADILKFAKKIGFASKKKIIRLAQLAKDARSFKRFGQQRSEKIVAINYLPPATVYDVEIPRSHRFIANGVISHNTAKSTILQYVKELAPKAIYVAGKGASGVGLTASAERDPESEEGWILKAGALVLASGGIVMVDEFDKMDKEDRSAIHEALEQQSYHSKTRILLADGSEKPIGPLVDSLIENGKGKVVQGRDCEILPLAAGELELFSSDFGSVFKASVDRVSRHKAPVKFVEITLQNGRSVTVTPEHPCWVVENGCISTKPAEKVSASDFLPIPTKIPLVGEPQHFETRVFDGRKRELVELVRFPKHNDADFCKFVGYLLTDGGYELNRGAKNGVNFTNKDDDLIQDFCRLSRKLFGLEPYVRSRDNGVKHRGLKPSGVLEVASGKREPAVFVKMARVVSMPLLRYLCCLDAGFAEKSDKKRVPLLLMKSSCDDLRPMLSAIFECDGWATSNRAGFISPNKEMCEQVQFLLLRYGIVSTLLEETTNTGNKVWKIDITGAENLRRFAQEIGFLSQRKREKLAKQFASSDYRTIKEVVPNIGLSVSRLCNQLKIGESSVLGYSLTPFKSGEQNVSRKALQKFASAFERKLSAFEEARKKLLSASEKEMRQIRLSLNVSFEDLEPFAKTSHQRLSQIERGAGGAELLRKALLQFAENRLLLSGQAAFFKRLAFAEIAWSRVKKTRVVPNLDQHWVYDVTVEPTRSFVSECMLLHNTISIAKAGMVTQFKAKTSVLAAANPKMGRFDPMTPPAAQFDIPPTLMSRFDLIFAIKDVLDESRDRKMADHILLGHRLAAEKKEPEAGSAIVPAINLGLFRKYVSYARRHVFPILTIEAGNRIKEYYLELRKLGAKQNTYPVTAREIEGLIRLSESSAKMRLSPTVELQDAERAVGISSYVLNDIFMDRSTGRIDSDIISIGQPKSKVDKLRQLLGVINALEQQYDLVDVDEIVKQAASLGFEENYARRLIDELKRQGDLYEPKVGFVKSSRGKEW